MNEYFGDWGNFYQIVSSQVQHLKIYKKSVSGSRLLMEHFILELIVMGMRISWGFL
ncbi:hypothetical protein Hanom_Chr06g00481981 [Helianthus anomalus]